MKKINCLSNLLIFALMLSGTKILAQEVKQRVKGPWIYEQPDYVPGKFGKGLRFNWKRSKLFLVAPGQFPLKEGTVQMWVAPVLDLKMLDAYGTLMSVAPAAKSHKHSQMILSFLPGRDARSVGSNGLISVCRSKHPGVVQKIALDWEKGDWHAIALSWGKGGLSLYIDGQCVARQKESVSIDEMPDMVSFGGGILNRYGMTAHSVIDEIEISDCERSPAYIKTYANKLKASVPDKNTIFLNSCEPQNPQGFVQITDGIRREYPVSAQSGSDFLGKYRLFDTGEKIKLPLYLNNSSNKIKSFSIKLNVKDFYDKKVLAIHKKVKIMPSQSQLIELSPELRQPGWYQYDLKVLCDGNILHNRKHAFVITDPIKKGVMNEDNYLGSHLSGTRNFGIFSRIGIPWERCLGGYFQWHVIEQEKGEFDWREPDFAVKEAKRLGLHLIGVLGLTPAWAGKVPANQAKWKNRAGAHRRTAYPPRDLKEFYRYVYKTVSRYKNDVKYWEIRNEPDWNRPDGIGVSFMGSDQDYLDMLKTAYKAAKDANPNCIILCGGMTPHEHLIRYLVEHDGLRYFDILGMHRYRPWSDFFKYAKLVNRKEKKPVWQTEKQIFIPSEVLTEIQTARLNGVGKYFIFDVNSSYFTEYDWSPKPIYFATALYGIKTVGKKMTAKIKFKKMSNLLSGILFDDGKKGKLATICFNYKGLNKLKIMFSAPKGETITATGYMGKETKFVSDGKTPISVPVSIMVYIEGEFNPASFRVGSFDEKSCLINALFQDVDGDFGIDGLRGMKLRYWTFRPKAGAVYLDKRKDGKENKLVYESTGKGQVYAFQTITLASGGNYELSAEFRKSSSSDTVRPYISVYNRISREVIWTKTWDNSGETYQRFSKILKVKEQDGQGIEISVIFGTNGGKGKLYMINPEVKKIPLQINSLETAVIDLKPYVNQSFHDDIANDGKGGWADMGQSNLSMLKTGSRMISNKPFHILDGTGNTCLILGGKSRPKLLIVTKKIKVEAKLQNISFLQTAMFVKAKKGKEMGRYIINYDDGSQSVFALIRGKNIDDWFLPVITSGMAMAEKVYSPSGIEYALFVATWHNPYPDKKIATIDFESTSNAAIALLAASGDIVAKNLLGGGEILSKDWIVWIEPPNKKAGSKVKFSKTGIAEVFIKELAGRRKLNLIQMIRYIKLKNDKTYKLSFDLDSNKSGMVCISYTLSKKPWTKYSKSMLKITPEQKSYEVMITPKGINDALPELHSLRFSLGSMPESKLSISNLKLVKIFD